MPKVYLGLMVVRPFQPHANLVQIKGQWTMDNNRTALVITWWTGSVAQNYTGTQLQAIGGAFNTGLAPNWAQVGAPSATYQGCTVTDWTSSAGLQTFVTDTTHGTPAGQLPNNTAILISLKVLNRYKGGKGRVYLPCIANTASTDGQNLASGIATIVQSGWQAVWTNMANLSTVSGGPVFQVLYRQNVRTSPPGVTPPTFQPAFTNSINSFSVSPMLATQRRRLRKVAHK